jgi:ABC-2 type transport system ATP-binding protein
VHRGDNVVVLRGVRKRYSRSGAWVLGGVDLTIQAGSGHVVVGSNGSGKSTLLRLVAGITRPTKGEVSGGAVSIAYAPERLAGNIRMSARVYLSHMAALRRVDADVARDRVDELDRRFGLLPGLDAPVRSLSKGNSQKVALMQAFVAPVQLLLLDEPYGGLDVQARDALSELIAGRIDAGAAVMLSSHIPLDLHANLRVLLLHDGLLREDDARVGGRPVLIRIVRAVPGADLDSVRAAPGVVAVREESDETHLTVEPAHSDAVLRIILARGWSVRGVT